MFIVNAVIEECIFVVITVFIHGICRNILYICLTALTITLLDSFCIGFHSCLTTAWRIDKECFVQQIVSWRIDIQIRCFPFIHIFNGNACEPFSFYATTILCITKSVGIKGRNQHRTNLLFSISCQTVWRYP